MNIICSSNAVHRIILYLVVKNQLVFFFHPKDSYSHVLGNEVINFSDYVAYLGVKISTNLSDDKDRVFLSSEICLQSGKQTKARIFSVLLW